MDEPFRKDMLDRSRRDRPLYLQVYEILRSHALNAAPDSGNVLPSTGRLAEMFGVAENTIRQAMNLLVEARLVCRIRHRGTVLTSEQLPDDPQGSSRSIGLVFPAEGYGFWRNLLQIMHAEAERNGYSLDIYLYRWNSLSDERRALGKAFRGCSGVILYPNSQGNDRSLIAEYNARRIPLVLFLLYYDDLNVSIVASGNYQAAYELTETLIRDGCRKIIFVHDHFQLITAKVRLAGYRKALEDNHLEFRSDLVRAEDCRRESGEFAKWIDGISPDGMVCCTPRTAVRILRLCRRPAACAVFLSQKERLSFPAVSAGVQTEELGRAAICEAVRRNRNPGSSGRKLQINLKIEENQDVS